MGQRMWQTPSAKQECRNCAYMRDLDDGECICGKDLSITAMEEYQESEDYRSCGCPEWRWG